MIKPHLSKIKTKVIELFAIDIRSLAIFRILLGSCWLLELLVRMTELKAFYSDQGILPYKDALHFFPETAPYSLLGFNGELWFQTLVFCVAILFTVFMILGFKTRISTVITWLLCISIQSRNEMILYGADHLIRVLLFWSMFLPLDLAWTWKNKRVPQNAQVFSIWTIAILIQISYFYFFSALLKTGTEWRDAGTALYFAFQYDQLTGDLGRSLLQFPNFLKVGSIATFYFELFIVAFLFAPFFSRTLRTISVTLLILFHLGIFFCMSLYLIPIVNIVALILFISSENWNFFKSAMTPTEVINESRFFNLKNIFASLLIAYFFLWNLSTVFPRVDSFFSVKKIGYFLRMDQNWGFYAPRPFVNDGWWIYPGKTEQGLDVDVWNLSTTAPSYDKPKKVSSMYQTQNPLSYLNAHWMAYSILSNEPINNPHHELMLSYLCRRWNNEGLNLPRLKQASIVYVEEETQENPALIHEKPKALQSKNCDF